MLIWQNYRDILSKLALNFNCDGLPISRSSKGQFWPILCSFQNINIRPFDVGIYYGDSKPNSAKNYLQELLSAVKELLEGITLNYLKHAKFWQQSK